LVIIGLGHIGLLTARLQGSSFRLKNKMTPAVKRINADNVPAFDAADYLDCETVIDVYLETSARPTILS